MYILNEYALSKKPTIKEDAHTIATRAIAYKNSYYRIILPRVSQWNSLMKEYLIATIMDAEVKNDTVDFLLDDGELISFASFDIVQRMLLGT